MFEVQDHEGRGGDPADGPGAETDVTQGFEGRLEQGVAAFSDRADGVVGSVELLLDGGAGPVFRFLERDGDGGLFAFVAQVAEHAQIVVGPRAQQGQDVVATQGGKGQRAVPEVVTARLPNSYPRQTGRLYADREGGVVLTLLQASDDRGAEPIMLAAQIIRMQLMITLVSSTPRKVRQSTRRRTFAERSCRWPTRTSPSTSLNAARQQGRALSGKPARPQLGQT